MTCSTQGPHCGSLCDFLFREQMQRRKPLVASQSKAFKNLEAAALNDASNFKVEPKHKISSFCLKKNLDKS
jgi:hypothetical protein